MRKTLTFAILLVLANLQHSNATPITYSFSGTITDDGGLGLPEFAVGGHYTGSVIYDYARVSDFVSLQPADTHYYIGDSLTVTIDVEGYSTQLYDNWNLLNGDFYRFPSEEFISNNGSGSISFEDVFLHFNYGDNGVHELFDPRIPDPSLFYLTGLDIISGSHFTTMHCTVDIFDSYSGNEDSGDPVPEPGTFILSSLGLVGLYGLKKKATKRVRTA